MYQITIVALILALLLLSVGCLQASEPKPAHKTLRVLTIGNSFSQNASQYLCDLAEAAGHKVILGHADIPGCPLDQHLALAELAEANPNDPAGKPYGVYYPVTSSQAGEHKSLNEVLTQDEWDIITIQQYSVISHDSNTYQPHARMLYDYIKKYAPQAEVVVHETWAYRCDDPRFDTKDDSQDKMYAALRKAYETVAGELGVRMIPSGDAFYLADTNSIWGYRPVEFDPSHAAYPELPDQTNSLHVGRVWQKDERGKHLMAFDGHHASALGCYLAGCVWFEFLFGESVVDNSFVPIEIMPSKATFLRKMAHEMVLRSEHTLSVRD